MKRRNVETPGHRGLSLIELLLALAISAMVAGAIAGMLGAVSAGVGTRRDNREIMVLAHAADCRLGAYLAPAKCVLSVSGSNLTLWFDDSRQSGTVHASEIRWLRFDAGAAALVVQYVEFPANWTTTACNLADFEYPAATDWEVVRASYDTQGLLATQTLVDQLDSVGLAYDKNTAQASSHITFTLGFRTDSASVPVLVSGTIRERTAPM